MEDKKQEIKDLFDQFDISIKIQNDNNETCTFKSDSCFIFLSKENNDISLSFDAACKPDYSAFIVSLITNNIDINNIFVSDLYYNNTKSTFFGEEANNQLMKDLYEEIIDDYVEYVKQFKMLNESDPGTIN